MNRIHLLYLMVIINILVIFYTLKKISGKEDFVRINKTVLIYITILIPFLGLLLLYIENRKIFSSATD